MPATGIPWSEILRAVRTAHPMLYRTWFDELPPGRMVDGQLVVMVNEPARLQFLSEHCRSAFSSAAMATTGHLLTISFRPAFSEVQSESLLPPEARLPTQPVNPDYTFEQFVVGPSNRLAHAACRAVCSQPGTLYNPLFIHGSSGLGKTHLLHAVCVELQEQAPELKFVNVSCETFVNEFVRAIETGRLPAFRDRAREADVLAIDDVQFLANRESSQEELFHTFNVLYQSRKQIILTSDSRPSDIPTLEDRLVSRFNWGLVTQVDTPNRETRHAILQKKSRLRGRAVPDEVLDYIAQRVEDNIRVLEGTLTKLISEEEIAGRPLTLETAKSVLDDIASPEPKQLTVNDILQKVSGHYGVKVSELVGRKRSRSIAFPRQVGMYLSRKLTPLSLMEIGNMFGGRDHSTVLHAERTIGSERERNVEVAHQLTHLTRELLGGD